MRLYGKLDPSVSYSDDRRGDWDSKRRILKRQTSKKTYVKSSINENYTFFMHAMVFIINGECDMALGDRLNAKTEQELIDDGAFINALVEKLAAGVGNSGVYTKTAANTAFVKTDGSNISTQADKGKALADAILAVQDNNKKSALVDKLGGFLDAADAVYGASSNQAAKAFLADKYPFVKTADLGAKVAEKAVVDVLVPALATVGTDDTKKVYTKSVADTAFAKIDASNLTEAANKKAFAEAILPAQDGDKSILVDKLGDAIASTDKAEYNVGTEQTAKQFLNSRGLIPSEDAIFNRLTSDDKFKTSVTIDVNASNNGFQEAVKNVMSQPKFDIPASDNVALDWTW